MLKKRVPSSCAARARYGARTSGGMLSPEKLNEPVRRDGLFFI